MRRTKGEIVRETFSRYDTADYLNTEADIAAYLEACADETPNDPVFMLKALGTVARARNMSQLADATGLTRAGLYKALSGEGNPSLANTMKVAKALEYRLALVPDQD
ncbi:MAG: addiction module antidote protein [Dokdonella sp.]